MKAMIQRRPLGLTLTELITAIILVSVVVLAISAINLFSHFHMVTSERRMIVQNELAYALEQMSRYVLFGVGNLNDRPIQIIYDYAGGPPTGFRVRVDPRITPSDLGDDLWFRYGLSGNDLTCFCSQANPDHPNPAVCPSPETLSTRILSGVRDGLMPEPYPPAGPIAPLLPGGFYISLSQNNTVIEVGLVARYNPSQAASPENPQVQMKARLYCRSASAR